MTILQLPSTVHYYPHSDPRSPSHVVTPLPSFGSEARPVMVKQRRTTRDQRGEVRASAKASSTAVFEADCPPLSVKEPEDGIQPRRKNTRGRADSATVLEEHRCYNDISAFVRLGSGNETAYFRSKLCPRVTNNLRPLSFQRQSPVRSSLDPLILNQLYPISVRV
jgi:hypothetical protein